MTKTFLDILLKIKKITKDQYDALKKELEASGLPEEEFLLGKFPEELVFEVKSKYYGVPLAKLPDDYSIDEDALAQIPEEVAKMYKIIPIKKNGSVLDIGMVNPQDIKASDAVKFILTSKSLSAHIFLITNTQFKKLFKQYSALTTKVKEALKEVDTKKEERKAIEEALKQEKLAEEAPINKIVTVIFKHAYEGGASDIHIEPLESGTRVRFRIDGVLHSSLVLPKDIHESLVSKIKILSSLKIDETRVPQDGRFRTKIDEKPVDFRVSTFPTTEGEKVVLRLLDLSMGTKSLEELGFVGSGVEVIKRGLKKPFGMILTTGPTGSGKSTTLQSMVSILNNEQVNIVSLEDPVEYYIDGVNQSQIRPEIQYDFASGLRSILRQDPNVIMVGEIRDSETAALSVHAALTGHIVFSTLHTNDVLGVIPRLVDMEVEPFLLPNALSIMIAQRLVRRLCDECKEPIEPKGRAKEILDKSISEMPKKIQENLDLSGLKIYQAKGCSKCGKKGTKGRVVIFEVLEMTQQLKDIIIKGEDSSKIAEEAKRQGMLTMRQEGVLKAINGVVSLEDVIQSTI